MVLFYMHLESHINKYFRSFGYAYSFAGSNLPSPDVVMRWDAVRLAVDSCSRDTVMLDLVNGVVLSSLRM